MANWQTEPGPVSLGYTTGSYWFRYQIPSTAGDRIFVIDNPWLLRFDLYLIDQDGSHEKVPMGVSLPTSERPLVSTVFALPLNPSIDQIYIHQLGESATNFPARLLSTSEYSSYQAALNNFHGFYYGLVLIMVLYNLALYFGTRDLAYIAYSVYAGALSFFLASADGTGALILWPNTPWMQYVAVTLGWGLAMITVIEFALRFMRISDKHLVPARIIQALVLLVSISSLAFTSSTWFGVQTIFSALALSYLVFLAWGVARAGRRDGRLFLIGNSVFVAGALFHVALLFGWIPHTPITHHLIHVGSIIELSFFAVALALRVRDNQEARMAAVRRSQELSRHNRELEIARSLAEEHRQLQRSVHQAQKLNTIGQLAGGFAHDFNNILASIMGFAELAQKRESQSDRAKLNRYLSEILNSGERGAALVRQLLVYSRSSPTEAQRIDLATTVRESLPLLTGSLPATVQIKADITANAVWIQSDPEYVQQLLVNLSLNAAEANNNRSNITITLATEQVDELTCTSCLQRFSGHYAVLKVEDDGPGISGNASDLFTPFHTSKDVGQGAGLGLSVVHGVTHDHGGHIHVTNRAMGGARFSLYLPLDDSPEMARVSDHRRILIIEDDPSVAEYLELLLEDADFDTTVTRLATQGLELFVAHPDQYDLVITDHLMPHTTGIELAKDLQAVRPDVPILMVTGNADIPDHELAESGVRGIFQKPLNSDHLLAKIQALLVRA